jgi:uncharacterized protein (DUF1697 family)
VSRYAALLRGINVGGNKKILMADLRALLSGLGHADVVTYLQSGNAVWTAIRWATWPPTAPPVGGFVEKHLKVTVTARNWNTVTRLAALTAG